MVTQLLNGMLNLMKKEGIIECDEEFEARVPFTSETGSVAYMNAPRSGLFVQFLDHCAVVKKDDKIGDIVNPLELVRVLVELKAPTDGILFTLTGVSCRV
jgi:uncharacterized protein